APEGPQADPEGPLKSPIAASVRWAPDAPTRRASLRRVISERAMRAVLVVLGVLNAASGALALVAPDTFFDQIGRYGAENSHYVGDVGAFVLAFGIAVLVAARRPSWRVPVLALGALWYGLHTLNHAFDVGQARSDAR